ncbi:MAG: hypothetical protein ACRDVF_17885 [Microbacterium sp.]
MAGAVAVVVLVGGAGTTALGRGAAPNPAPKEVVVTEDDGNAPPRCRPHRIGSTLMRWNRALNAADTEALRAFWREGREGLKNDRRGHARGTFKWFSPSDSPSPTHADHFAAFQPRRALRYVQKRRGFRLQLTEVAGTRGVRYRGMWVLDDGSTYQVLGKGEILCKGRRRPLIRVWSMRVAAPGEEVSWEVCPDPPGGSRPGVLVACARGSF